jgi:glutathionyl-hydroquinone reductase
MGPFPDIEEGVESDLSKLRIGEVKLPVVKDYESKM